MSGYQHTLLGLISHTAIHAGSGESDHIIDQPIQREAHTDWPCIYGSSMKGAFRSKARNTEGISSTVERLFGKDPDQHGAHDQAGELMISDARLLLLPVRSLNTHYRWVTCPAILGRLKRDLQRLGDKVANKLDADIPVDNESAVVASELSEALYLEEYRLTIPESSQVTSEKLTAWVKIISKLVTERDQDITNLLTIVSDDTFRHLCRAATPVSTHVRLKTDTKTNDGGALWTMESLPPDTLMYVMLSAATSRSQGDKERSETEFQQTVTQLFKDPYVQVGGNETTGMGWLQVKTWQEQSDE
ncbi:type III-B CRISPR module RAMP protein Cmr4 [Gynuella sunshinyii]|uniref:Uncharacterized protein predicted to be involved in DNA repair (RAMP superfamily) n=1 Tax=Gynuella sunshinyii YC6258 TaxID=1445510 RepID=A0A0C5VF62_9GAMM|nr:type III-B CRISPR module RAMP protein Cmr4 [Gynuella sunshinyii]AJQ93187.1 uncharacterized protein predicted to be involved in DNA repair (RAMP superfamily) [Gynuella sunshinyii YC6258]